MKRLFLLGLVVIALAANGQIVQAGANHGPATAMHVVEDGDYDVFHVTFQGGQWASVRIHGYGSTVLEGYVLDSAGNEVGAGNDYNGDCMISWVPPRDGVYTIVVVNRGSTPQKYFISHN